ncbi:MAG: aldo/keto reductase family oxidoreductase [Betaproteobacteria bacterium]|nr:MAG: aldo/keto reductase family oxidoreductase [Betaproteobacteria bacterium]
MRTISVGPNKWAIPELALGCMRIAELESAALDTLIATAFELGFSFFDHADIYGAGRCETVFAESVARLKIARDRMMLQSKCGIHDGQFDFSRAHIVTSVEGSLRRLNTEYLDVLVLHRPDALVEPDEVARAFDELETAGKVRAFGVSNHNPIQIALLQRSLTQPLLFNQLQLSIAFTPLIDAGLHVNMRDEPAVMRDGGALDYCRLKGITVQAWSPFQHGFFKGTFLANPQFSALNAALRSVAEEHGVSDTAVAVAWISRHPARIQTILGTTSPLRLRDAVQSQDFVLSRTQWYEIYKAAGNSLP